MNSVYITDSSKALLLKRFPVLLNVLVSVQICTVFTYVSSVSWSCLGHLPFLCDLNNWLKFGKILFIGHKTEVDFVHVV